MAAAAVVVVAWTTLLLTAFRGGWLTAGRPWPMLTNRRFGTTGWRAFLTRSVHLSAMVMVVVAVSVLAQIATGSGLANALAAVVLSTVGVVLVPYLAGSRRTSASRASVGPSSASPLGSALLVTATGTTSDGWMALLVVSVLAASDTRPADAARRRWPRGPDTTDPRPRNGGS